MTLPPEMPGPDPLLDEAIAWIVRLKTEEVTRGDVEDFQRWRAQSPAHEAAFQRATIINQRAGVVAGRLTSTPQPSRVASLAASRGRLSRRAVLGGGLAAAAVAGYAVVRPPFGLWPSLQEFSADYRTGKGEQRTVDFTPGVSLDLNTLTSVALRSQENRPTIELLSGEVVVNARRPPQGKIILLAAGGRISATEARFNARCLDDAVSIACLSGTLTIRHAGKSAHIAEGEQVSYTSTTFGPPLSVDPTQVTAWQSGLLIFRDRSLASVVEEINRYRSGKIVVVSAALRQRTVNADFEIAKLETFITQVQQLTGARVTELPGGLVLLS